MAKEQVSSILRALEILECFMDNETEWTLKRLVAQLDLPTTTVHRQLSTLTDRGYLVQDPVRKSYRVGPRLLLLSSTVLSHSDLRSTARPELEKLSGHCEGDHQPQRDAGPGDLLSGQSGDLPLRGVQHESGHPSPGPRHQRRQDHAGLSRSRLCGRLLPGPAPDAAADGPHRLLPGPAAGAAGPGPGINGFAIDDGEIEPGLICVGAPIFGLDQTVVAAVSIAGPTFRMKEELDVMTRAVKATAANISRLMGGRP